MITGQDCKVLMQQIWDYAEGALPPAASRSVEDHIQNCRHCREGLQSVRETQALLSSARAPDVLGPEFAGHTRTRLASMSGEVEQASAAFERLRVDEPVAEDIPNEPQREFALGSAPWWAVSLALHVLIIALAGLITMAVELPRADESVIMVTELLPHKEMKIEEEEKSKPDTENALESKLETPPTDPASKDRSDVVVPPDILAKAELGDHFETVNLDRPDTQSAFGNPDAHMFHSVRGNDDPEGGGGLGGAALDDLIGVGGNASPGSGGGWGGGHGTGTGVGNGACKGSFGNRNGGGRKLMVRRHGGSRATENSVDLALRWLAYHQEADGHWDSKKYKGKKVDTAMTGLALLAFLGAGHTEKVGEYKNNVRRAVAWLKSKQEANGLVFDRTDECLHAGYTKELGYGTAFATLALAEAAGMANIPETRDCAQKAINYCTEVHEEGEGSTKGAWRYSPKAPPDLSVSGWYIMALKSAKVAGLHVNPASFEGAMKFLDKMEVKEAPGAYGPVAHYRYMDGNDYPSPESVYRMASIGVLGRQFLGWQKEKLQGGVEWFVEKGGVPQWGAKGDKVDLYYW